MNRMCLRAALLLGSCLFLRVASHAGKIFPPRNLSLTWISEFKPQLSWEPPQHWMGGCSYIIRVRTREISGITNNTWTSWVVMKGAFLPLSVTTECNGIRSEPAVHNVSHPELVKSWSCYIRSRDRSYCSWEPASSASNASFYYLLEKEGLYSDDDDFRPIRECRSYEYHDDGTRGCEIEVGDRYRIYILFNETQNNSRVWNTFDTLLSKKVRPAALNWTVQKTKDAFHITWTPPDVSDDNEAFGWTYVINYTECDHAQIIQVYETSFQLVRQPHCPYRIRIKAQINTGESPWSDEKRFDADSGPSAAVYAAVIIPLLFACLAALTIACCRKNKENLFPKVPQPRDLLSDIADNNNKSAVCNVYVPATEEETCKISLVIDPQVNKPDR